jgi:hypothetical protein
MNSIGAAWETWTPTVTASAGTITTGATTLARYARVQNLVFVMLDYSITTAGTAAGANLVTTLPVAPLAAYPNGHILGTGREYSAVGFMLQGFFITPNCRIADYTGVGWIQNGRSASISLCYEAA